MEQDLDRMQRKEKSPIHEAYAQTFNAVDLLNGRWYCTDKRHATFSWKYQILLAIMRYGIINAYASSENNVDQSYTDWRRALSEKLILLTKQS
jgi:hypothetical protein